MSRSISGVIFGTLTLLTGSVWAKISWGHFWLWDQKQLVLFLVLFLFYCAYFMLRFSVEDGPQRVEPERRLRGVRRVLIPVSSSRSASCRRTRTRTIPS